jgi:hypothetical protein
MVRNFLKNFALGVTNLLIHKYNTRIIVIYGWDWSEGLRESTYNLVSKKAMVRRNTDWIDWDMGMPLFIMGFPYSSKISRLRIFYYLSSSLGHIYYPSGLKRNYLIVSLHARTLNTVRYWGKIHGIEKVIVLPINEKLSEVKVSDLKGIFSEERIIDLTKTKLASKSDNSKDSKLPWQLNFIQIKLLGYLQELDKVYFRKKSWGFSEDELSEAVVKIDWEKYFLERVEHNLFKDTNA